MHHNKTENRSPSPPPARRARSKTERFAVSKEVFEAEIFEYMAIIQTMYKGLPGDHVVALALVNPLANTASPSAVLQVLQDAALPAGGLWARFKASGGVSKELGHVDESEQLDALRTLWAGMVAGQPTAPSQPRSRKCPGLD